MDKFMNSVYLDTNLCKGCINCIKRCPTQAIRVRDGKAEIKKEYCIDCGVCIRICQHHAKHSRRDSIDRMKDFEYTIVLPAPSLFGQFNNLDDPNILLSALKLMGFNDVYEVAAAAELVSELSRKYIAEHRDQVPFISTACPSVTRLIRVRFPNLLDHLLPIQAPVEIAAHMAREKAMKETGLPSEKIGIFFISPCPSKVTAVKSPLGYEKSDIDAVLAIKDIYPMLVDCMSAAVDSTEDLNVAGRIGFGWGVTGGEAGGLLSDNYLAADGIENVIRVLEDLEDQKFTNLDFIELNSCDGGCVGGVLTVENPFIAMVKLKRLKKYLAVAGAHMRDNDVENPYWSEDVEYEPVFKLGHNMKESIELMSKIDRLQAKLPGLDCGSCGAPTCRALAEDIVRGNAKENDCIYILKDYIHKLSSQLSQLDD